MFWLFFCFQTYVPHEQIRYKDVQGCKRILSIPSLQTEPNSTKTEFSTSLPLFSYWICNLRVEKCQYEPGWRAAISQGFHICWCIPYSWKPQVAAVSVRVLLEEKPTLILLSESYLCADSTPHALLGFFYYECAKLACWSKHSSMPALPIFSLDNECKCPCVYVGP